MNVESVRAALLCCTAINIAMVLLWAALFLLAPRFAHLHGRWFGISSEQSNVINYGGIVLYELGIFLFNLVPYIALRIVA